MKHIKKSMFISTVLMVVMLIAALSTATFAWYTSNSSVTSAATAAQAAQANDANLKIGWFSGQTLTSVEFNSLQFKKASDSNELYGELSPAIPSTYFYNANEVGENGVRTTIPDDAYITSTESTYTNSNGGVIDDAFIIKAGIPNDNYDPEDPENEEPEYTVEPTYETYLRVVQLGAVSDSENNLAPYSLNTIVAKSAYTHRLPTAEELEADENAKGVVTNLHAADFHDRYEIVYYTYKYAFDTPEEAPAVGDIVTINNDRFTKIDTTIAGTCYEVSAVYQVIGTGANSAAELATRNDDDDNTNDNQINASYAGSLIGKANVGPSNATIAVSTPGVVVQYKVYKTMDYYMDGAVVALNRVSSYDVEAVAALGYTAEAAGKLNDGDIPASVVMSDQSNGYDLAEPMYNTQGFAYLYQIWKKPAAETAITAATNRPDNDITWANFKYLDSTIDAQHYFKDKGGNITPSEAWTGTQKEDETENYKTGDQKVAVLTGFTKDNNPTVASTVYVTNAGNAEIANLKVSIQINGTNNSLLRIAVFRDGKYYGTLAFDDDTDTSFGPILKGAKSTDMPKYTANSTVNTGALAGKNTAAAFEFVVWFDGTDLQSDNAGNDCSFLLTFSA